jgi:outer membrane protein OmpA-like peptidoglycan-associated protein
MRTKLLLATTAIVAVALAAPLAAQAQVVTGPYVSLGAGWELSQDQFLHTDQAISGIPGNDAARLRWSGAGFQGEGSIGYGFGMGLRVEIEGLDYYQNADSLDGVPNTGQSASGNRESYGGLANVLYDVDLNNFGINAGGLTPYVGVGGGYVWTHLSPVSVAFGADNANIGGTSGSVAYQGIIGVSYAVAPVPGLAVGLEYRYLGTIDQDAFHGTNFQPFGTNKGNVDLSNQANHTVMLSLRYALFQPAPAAPPPPPPVQPPPPPVQEARTYLVFFDWDRADLTTRARQIVAEAAAASTHVQTTRIDVNGYTDLSGTAAYNQKLSVRRAMSVEAELVRDGVAKSEIDIHGFGESNPLVPTAKGVREPQNRRVEIILH